MDETGQYRFKYLMEHKKVFVGGVPPFPEIPHSDPEPILRLHTCRLRGHELVPCWLCHQEGRW